MRSLLFLCLVGLLAADGPVWGFDLDLDVISLSKPAVDEVVPAQPAKVEQTPTGALDQSAVLSIPVAPVKEQVSEAPAKEQPTSTLSDDHISGIRQYLRKPGAVTAKINYDVTCTNNDFGKFVGISGGDDSELVITGTGADPLLEISAIVRNTGNQDHSGHGDASGTAEADFKLGAGISLKGRYSLFRKGDGFPDWEASTGNPYIYFQNQNVDGVQWNCECVSDTPLPSCETVYMGGKPTHSAGCCEFTEPHVLNKNPVTPDGQDYDSDGPKRSRGPGDLYVGRCNQLDKDESLSFKVECSASGAALADIVDIYPSCASAGHNLAIGVGMSLRNNRHHTVVASQIPPAKFVECNGDPFSCKWGHGPHEASNDEACFRVPVSGALVDKSSGNSANQYQDLSGPNSEYLSCEPNPGEVPSDGSGLLVNNNSQADSTFGQPSEKEALKDFTTCGVGGNPCLTQFDCAFDGGDCFQGDGLSGTDVLGAIAPFCATSDENKCGTSGGCRCASIRKLLAPAEVDCAHTYWDEDDDEEEDDEEHDDEEEEEDDSWGA